VQRLILLGLNHTTAPLEVRERLAFSAPQQHEAIERFRAQFPQCEAVLLSTCNRVELYAARPVHDHPRGEEMVGFLANFHGVAPEQIRSHFYEKAERAAVEHLFAVACSLDSMVLGETQILGQVREAYDISQQLGAAGAVLNPLFQRALAVGKQVMRETRLAEGRLSVASIAVDYARRIFEQFTDKTVLSIGAGKMSQLVLQQFASLKPKRLLVCNRDAEKAADLAKRFGGEAVSFDQLPQHLVAADIVLTGTGSERPIITRAMFEQHILKARRYRPIFLIDIAVPRDVEASVGELDHVYLYNLDDLQQVVSTSQSQRSGEADAARKIVAEHVDAFVAWHRTRELGPAIDALYKRYHAVAQDELARTLNKLPNISDAERAHLEELARRIVNKLLHDPVTTLRESEGMHTNAAQYLHALEKLFQLQQRDSDADAASDADTRNE
jgi:glutamyl-tRNA reductase